MKHALAIMKQANEVLGQIGTVFNNARVLPPGVISSGAGISLACVHRLAQTLGILRSGGLYIEGFTVFAQRCDVSAPTFINAPWDEQEFRHQPSKHQLLERTPFKRPGGLTEVVDAMELLFSDRAPFINSPVLLVDGGIAAAVEFGR